MKPRRVVIAVLWVICCVLWGAWGCRVSVPQERTGGETSQPPEPPACTSACDGGEQATSPEETSQPEPAPTEASPPERTGGERVAGVPRFLQKSHPQDIRVATYNIEKNSVFEAGSVAAARFARVVKAIKADVWALQEVSSSTDAVAQLFDKLLPLPGGARWHARYGGSTTTVSRYPITLHHYQTEPSSGRKVSLALIDLPDSVYLDDLYIANNHFTCCGGAERETSRQKEADQLVNWLRTARTAGGTVSLPKNTPIVILGDLNLVGSKQPLKTLLEGDILHEDLFGKDSPPDWDGSSITATEPLHNAVGPDKYTWRWDGSGFLPSRIDYILYTDSNLQVVNQFVLNTVLLSPQALKAAGLEDLDVAKSRTLLGSLVYDHLPVVADFRIKDANP